jgi:nitroreductase
LPLPDFDEVLSGRRSVRRFRAEPPPDDVIEALLAQAVLAPSASNKQPWRFFVVANRALINAMAVAVATAVDEVARVIPPESEESFRAYGDYFTRFSTAPRVIVPIHRGHRVLSNLASDGLTELRRDAIVTMERDSGLVGTALALQNLLLAAHARGLGASAMTGPLVAARELATLLDIPSGWGLVALVALGYPDETPRATERKSVEKVTRWLR